MKKSEHAVADWAKLVQSAQREPLDNDSMEFLMKVVFIEGKLNADESLVKTLESGRAGYASVFWKRMRALNVEVSPSLALVVGDSCLNNFGVITMISAYLKWWCYEHQKNSVSLDDWCKEIFPLGYPNNKTWEKLWDEQKDYTIGGTANILDCKECYKSMEG